MASNDRQITCRFFTALPGKYRVASAELAVPANLTRYGLSQIINHLLGLESNPVPFDFLVNGELVRLSLGKLLLSQNLSTESVLDIEYILAYTPPENKQQLPHNDWQVPLALYIGNAGIVHSTACHAELHSKEVLQNRVSAVDGKRDEVILSGCYDGIIRAWDYQGQLVGDVAAHKGPISALKSLKKTAAPLVISSGKLDHVIRLLQMPSDAVHSTRQVAVYKGHQGSILDIAVNPSEGNLVSASQDKMLRIWPTGEATAAEAGEQGLVHAKGKKQKLENGSSVLRGGMEVEASDELGGHSDAVTAVEWTAAGHIYSGSMDHSVWKWDAETRTHVDTYNGAKAVTCLAVPHSGREVVAFGGAAKLVRIWDPRRKQADDAGVKTLSSHTSVVQAVAWHPNSEHHLATASMDKTLKLWDMRSAVPLHTLKGHTEQVLCAAWWRGDTVVSGGADGTVQVFRSGVEGVELS